MIDRPTKKNISSKTLQSALKRGKNIYDIVHSEELELLYKKNEHLLARLSKAGRENTRLYSQLSSLNKEKSYLGDKNTDLKNKFLSLKEQISLFARQHREFNKQSFQIKEGLRKAKNLQIQEIDDGLLDKQKKEIILLEKKGEVWRKQINNLQNQGQKKEEEKQKELNALQKEHKKTIQILEGKIQKLYQVLSEERDKFAKNSPLQIKKIKSANQNLNKKIKSLELALKDQNKKLRSSLKDKQALILEQEKFKSLIEDKTESLRSKNKTLQLAQKKSANLKAWLSQQNKRQDYEKRVSEAKIALKKDYEKKVNETKIALKRQNESLRQDYEKKAHETKIALKRQQASLKKDYEKRINKAKTALKRQNERLQKDYEANFKQLKAQKEELAQAEKKREELLKENKIFKAETKEKARQLKTLQEREKFSAEENKKAKSYKKEAQRLKASQESVLVYKNKISEMAKQTEELKAHFSRQRESLTKERDYLKDQSASFKKALSMGKLGFDQALLSFQKKYKALASQQKKEQKTIEEKTNQIKIFKEKICQLEKDSINEEELNHIKKQAEKQISHLKGELKASKEYSQDLENRLLSLKVDSENFMSQEKKRLEEEIKSLKWNQDKNQLTMETDHKKEIENLKGDYETRIDNLEVSFKKKLQHIRIEMENDLLCEKKRHEVFKNMKTKAEEELKASFFDQQRQNEELRSKNFILEKSLEETKKNLDKYLKNNKKWEDQKEHLTVLWQEAQKQSETKEQQIQALRRLNRSLSLSINENKKKEISFQNKNMEFLEVSPGKKELKKEKQPATHVLADIHFD